MRLCSLFGLLLSNVAQISANGSGFVIRVLGRLRGLLPGEVGAQPSGNSGSTERKEQRPLAASADFRPWRKPALAASLPLGRLLIRGRPSSARRTAAMG